MKRRFVKRWTLIKIEGKKPTVLAQSYDPKTFAWWLPLEEGWTVETETVMLLSVNGALPAES